MWAPIGVAYAQDAFQTEEQSPDESGRSTLSAGSGASGEETEASDQSAPPSAGSGAMAEGEADVYPTTIPVVSPEVPHELSADTDESAQLEDVIVTGQKRSERLQRAAASITAISGDEIERRGLHNIEEVTRTIPNVTMTTENLLGLFNIRGMGKPTQGYFDPSTTAIVDDVPLPAGYLAFAFLDLESIEVMRGPQGTLYGKNNTAGVFRIATRDPGYEFSARINGTIGSYGTQRAQGVLNVPLWDDLAGARLRFVYDKRDGYMENTYRQEDDGATTRGGLSAKVRFDLAPSLSLTTNVLYQMVDQPRGWGYQAVKCPPALLTSAQLRDPQFECEPNLTASRDAPEVQDGDAIFGSGVLSWTNDGYEVKGFASYYKFDSLISYDADYSPQNLLLLPLAVNGDAISSEVRLLSPTSLWDGDLSFIAGLYGLRETTHVDTSLLLAPLPCLPPLCGDGEQTAVERIDQIQDKRVTELAGFIQGTYKIVEPLDLTIGTRYSRVKSEELYGENRNSCAGLGIPCVLGTAANISNRSVSGLSRQDNAISYNAALRYFINDDVTTYVSAATGFKAGGYALTLVEENGETVPDEYEAEDSISYEVGAKFQFWGGAARVNLAAFSATFDNFQVPLLKVFTTENGNAGQAKTRGIELESIFLLPPGLRLALNGSYLKAIYSDYRDAPCPESGGNAQDTDNNPATPAVCDLSGRTLANAPKWKAAGILDGSWQLFDLPILLTAGGDATWQSKVWFQSDTDPNDTQEAYWLFNARCGIAGVNGDWDVGFAVNNLTNEYVLQTSNDIPVIKGGHWGSLAAPRWFNVSLSWRFGE